MAIDPARFVLVDVLRLLNHREKRDQLVQGTTDAAEQASQIAAELFS